MPRRTRRGATRGGAGIAANQSFAGSTVTSAVTNTRTGNTRVRLADGRLVDVTATSGGTGG